MKKELQFLGNQFNGAIISKMLWLTRHFEKTDFPKFFMYILYMKNFVLRALSIAMSETIRDTKLVKLGNVTFSRE